MPESPFVNGTTIDATPINSNYDDIANALTGSLASDGQTPMTGNLDMNGNDITNLAALSATNLSVSGNLAVIGTSAFTGNASFAGAVTLTGGGITVEKNSTFKASVSVGSNLSVAGTGTFGGAISTTQVTTSGSAVIGANVTATGAVTGASLTVTNGVSAATGVFSGKVSADGGTSGDEVVNWSQFDASLGTNSYAKVASGFITQSGTGSTGGGGSGTVTFPIAFPSKIVSFTATPIYKGGVAPVLYMDGDPTTSAADVITVDINGTLRATDFMWTATGY